MPTSATDLVELGDGDLWVRPGRDDASGPDAIVPGWGGTHREGLGVRAERGGVDLAVVGGLVLDPVLGVRRTSIGVRGGRVCAVGRAGNPDTMDGIEVVLDSQTALVDARGAIVTPGVVDSHVHWLSPQLAEAALAGGVTTVVAQDYGPVWNLGANPAQCLATAWAAFEGVPLNAAFLVRASSRPEGVTESLAAGGAGLKIHEDVSAGPEQLRGALDVADRHDVQLAIHTDGLNEALLVADTAAVLAGRTAHLYHIEGAGGGHAPDLLSLAGRERLLTSSTNPTVPFGVGAEAEHLAMVAAVHLLEPGVRAGDAGILRERVRPWTMAAETVLHDLGVIPMLSSDSQGMGRIGETLRRAFQCAALMKAARGRDGAADDNDRVLRYLAKVTVNPAITHGLSAHVGSLQAGRLADLSIWWPGRFPVRPELVLKAGMPAWGASGAGNATTMLAEPVRIGPQLAAVGGAPARTSLAFMAAAAMSADLPITRTRAAVSGCRELTAADMVMNTRTGTIAVDPVRRTVSLDGEVVTCVPAERVAYSGRYLF